MYDVIIIGAGASGLMAAAAAASKGARVALLEHKDDIGKKILATGNGRCNFTNTDMSVNKFHGSKALIRNLIIQTQYVFLKNLEYLHMTMQATFIQIQDRLHLLWQPFAWSL